MFQKATTCATQYVSHLLHTFSVKRMSLKMNSQGWVTGLNTIQVSIDSAPFILGHFVTWGLCALHWYGPCSFCLWGQDEFGIEMSSWNQCLFKTGQKHIEIHGISSCSIWNMSTSMLDWWMFTNVPASCLSLSLSNHWSGQSSFGDFFCQSRGLIIEEFVAGQASSALRTLWSVGNFHPFVLSPPRHCPKAKAWGGVKEACFFAFLAVLILFFGRSVGDKKPILGILSAPLVWSRQCRWSCLMWKFSEKTSQEEIDIL